MAQIFDRVLLVKSEVTKGTDALPVEADACLAITAEVTPSVEAISRKVIKSTMNEKEHALGKKSLEFKITLENKGSGTAGVAPEFAPLLKACYLTETVNAGVSVEYTHTTRTPTSCTIYLYKDGQLWKGLGCVGNAVFTNNIGESSKIEFTMKALYTVPVNAAVPTAPVFDATQPVISANVDLVTENAGTILTGALNFDLGLDVVEHYTTSNHEFTAADSLPGITITKDSVSTATEWNALMNGDTVAILATYGNDVTGSPQAGNMIDYSFPNCVRLSNTYGERSERDIIESVYRAYESTATGDDAFTLTYS